MRRISLKQSFVTCLKSAVTVQTYWSGIFAILPFRRNQWLISKKSFYRRQFVFSLLYWKEDLLFGKNLLTKITADKLMIQAYRKPFTGDAFIFRSCGIGRAWWNKRCTKLRGIRLCNWQNRLVAWLIGSLAINSNIFCAAHCRWLFIGALSKIIVPHSIFWRRIYTNVSEYLLLQCDMCDAVCVRIFRPWSRRGKTAVEKKVVS